jgi:hypothetical protein
VSGTKIITVEQACDHVVAAHAHKHAYCLHDSRGSAIALSASTARQAQLGVSAAHPMHDKNDLPTLHIEVGDHLANKLPHDPFLQTDVGGRITPDRFQISRQCRELLGARRRPRRRFADVLLDSALEFRDAFESAVPTKLQFRRDQTIGWIGGVVLSERLVRSIAGRLEVTLERVEYFVAAACLLSIGLQRRFNRSRFEHTKKLVFDRVIDAKAAERDAAWLSVVEPAASA